VSPAQETPLLSPAADFVSVAGIVAGWNTGVFSWDDPKQRELCLTSLDNWHSGQGGPPSKDMTWEWDAFSYPFSSSANTRAGRPSAALGNLTLMLRTVWPKKQLNWGCPHDGPAWPGSRGDKQCIGSSMQPNTFQGENGGDGHADPTSETPLALATSVQDLFLFSDDDSDAIRVFQGFDSTVEEAAFHQLRGAGALLVSGARSSAATHFVRVERVQSTTDDAVVLFPPPDWAGQELVALGNGPAVSKGPKPGSVTFALKDGEAVVLHPQGKPPSDLTIRPAKTDGKTNWWGMHPGGAGRD